MPGPDDPEPTVASLTFRRPTEADHALLASVVDGWWGHRRARSLVRRAWIRHFGSTAWLAIDGRGGLAGFVLGYVGQVDPSIGVIHAIGVRPGLRRRGIGRALVERFVADVRERGGRTLETTTEAGDPVAVGFFVGLGFEVDDGPGSRRLYGVPSMPDYEGEGEDRVILRQDL